MAEIGQTLEALLVERSLEEYRGPDSPVRLTTAFPHGLQANVIQLPYYCATSVM